MLDHVAQDRPTNQTILADAERWLDKVTAFVREDDLVRVPDEPLRCVRRRRWPMLVPLDRRSTEDRAVDSLAQRPRDDL